MLRVAGAPTSILNESLAMTSENDDGDGDAEVQETQRNGEEQGRSSQPVASTSRAAASITADRSESDPANGKKTPYTAQAQMLKPKNGMAENETADTSFAASSTTSESLDTTPANTNPPYSTAHYPNINGTLSYSSAQAARAESAQTSGGGDTSVFGTFRSSIPQEVFEKIKERITASREREKQSVAKQILRKEEEKKKLARERDAEDLESTIHTLRENIRVEKSKRQVIYNQIRQKYGVEENLKMQISTRDRGREMSNHGMHHSYPNATMLISQTNPSMRPRLMQNYPPVNLPMNAMLPHQNNSHMQDPHAPNLSKRQRSVSPGQIPGPGGSSSAGSGRHMDSAMSHGRSGHSQQPPSKMARPGAQNTPDTHGGGSSHSRGTTNKSHNKSQLPSPGHHSSAQQGGSSQQQQQPPLQQQQQQQQPMAGQFTVASPYGNQVLCLINPNMVGASPNGQPQFINPAFLQKPEHFAALSQQQQALMAQQIHAMNQMSPDYLRAMQHLSDNQQRSLSSEANAAALYRQYQAAAGMSQPVMLRPGLQMPQEGNSSSQGRSSHGSSNLQPSGSHSDRGQNPDHGSQRVGGITSGQPVFGHTMAHNPYGMSGNSRDVSSRDNPGNYSRSGASS